MNYSAIPRIPQQDRKDPWLAVFLSEMLPGAGQIYGGKSARGLIFFFLSLFLFLIIPFSGFGFLSTESAPAARAYLIAAIAAMLLLVVFDIYILFDAYKVTKRCSPDDTQTATVGYRKAWLAAFLSAIIPGIGQFYNKQVIKGISLLAGIIVVAIFDDYYPLLIIVGLLVWVLGVKDAFDSAETLNRSSKRFFQQDKTIVLLMLIMFSLESIPLGKIIHDNFLEAFTIPAASMYPTLKIGDHLLTAKAKPFFASIQKGDIVVFPFPKNPEKNFIKRVIGLGGDKVQIINGELYINEQLVPSKKLDIQAEAFIFSSSTTVLPTVYEEQIGNATYRVQYLFDKSRINGGPWLVPQDAVFVLGDNRDNSMDSRYWGTVQRSTIIGKAIKIYWSWDREEKRVRWERIGEGIH